MVCLFARDVHGFVREDCRSFDESRSSGCESLGLFLDMKYSAKSLVRFLPFRIKDSKCCT
jgi:hypothetical protein